MARYSSKEATAATEAYATIAAKHNLTLTQLSLAFVTDRPFVTSNIIGATTMEQLAENIATADVTLSADILAEIDAVHNRMPNPSP